MAATRKSEEHPKRQRGKPERFKDDVDGDDSSVNDIDVQSNRVANNNGGENKAAAATAGGNRGGEKGESESTRIKIKLGAVEGWVSPTVRGKRKRAADNDDDLESESFTSQEEVEVQEAVNDEPRQEGPSLSDDGKNGKGEVDSSNNEVESEEEVDEIEVDEIDDVEEGGEEELNAIKEDEGKIELNQQSNESNGGASDEDDESSSAEDGEDASVIEVRVRVAHRLQDEVCRAILPPEFKWGVGAGSAQEDAITSVGERKPAAATMDVDERHVRRDWGDDAKPAAIQVDEKTTNPINMDENTKNELQKQPRPILDFAVSNTTEKKANGATKCRAVGCPKNSQSHSEGFCRAHHNRFLICTGQCDSWDCVCGEKIASLQSRCGQCHRWRDGKHPSSGSKAKRIESPAKKFIPAKEGADPLNHFAAAASDAPSAALTHVPPDSGVEISSITRTNEKGRSLCKVIGCGKMDQSNNDGFCRMHFNMFAVCEVVDNMVSTWTCICGQIVSGTQKRCGKCNKWKGGKREPYCVSKKNGISEDNIIYNDDGAAFWKCDCGNEVPSAKARCGRCHHWRGGKRQGGWKLGSTMGREYESDDGIDRTKDWTCCGMIIMSRQTRCGKCNGWRGGKRIASKGLPASEVPDNRPPWECGKCGASNAGSKRRCGECQEWKGNSNGKSSGSAKSNRKGGSRAIFDDAEYLVEGDRSHSWQCQKCNFDNFETEIACFMCQQTRPNWQMHKKQMQLISSCNTVPGAASPVPVAQYPVQAPTAELTSFSGGTPQAPDSVATALASVTSQGESAPETLNYYGTYNDGVSYPYISIHYDFNQSYYSNHDYSYLNSGIGGSSIPPRDGQRRNIDDGNEKDTRSAL